MCAITIVMRTYSNGIFSNGKQSNKNVIKGFEETQKWQQIYSNVLDMTIRSNKSLSLKSNNSLKLNVFELKKRDQ